MNIKWFLLSFSGRINRLPFWMFTLCAGVLWLLLNLALGIDILHRSRDAKSFIPTLVLLWPSLAVQAKRWHDRDKSAWWLLINIVPIIGPIWALIETGFLSGTSGENQYGEDPLGRVSKNNTPVERTSEQVTIPKVEWKPQKYYLSAFMKAAMVFGIAMVILTSVLSLLMRNSFAIDMPGPVYWSVVDILAIALIIWRIRTPLIELTEEGVRVSVPFIFKTNFARWDEIEGMVIGETNTLGIRERNIKILVRSGKGASTEMLVNLKAAERPDEIIAQLRLKIHGKENEDIRQAVSLQKPLTISEIKYKGWSFTPEGISKGNITVPWENVQEIKYAGLVIAGYGGTTITCANKSGNKRTITLQPSTSEQYQNVIRFLIQYSQKASIDPGLLKALEYSPKDAKADILLIMLLIPGIFLFFIAISFLNYYSPTVTTGNLYPFLVIPFGLVPIGMAIKLIAGRFRGKIEPTSRKILWSSLAFAGPVTAILIFFMISPFSYYWFVGDIFNKTGNPEKAEVWYRDALERYPESIDIPYEMGKIYRAREEWNKASEYLQRAYTKDPTYWGVIAIELIPDTLMKAGKYDEALQWCERILKDLPQKIDVAKAINRKQDEIISEKRLFEMGLKNTGNTVN